MNVKNKLLLLKQSNQINENTFKKAINVFEIFKSLNININSPIGSMFFLHLAKALQRIANNQAETKDVASALQDCKSCTLAKAKKILHKIEDKTSTQFNKGEKEYVLIYIHALLQENNKKDK